MAATRFRCRHDGSVGTLGAMGDALSTADAMAALAAVGALMEVAHTPTTLCEGVLRALGGRLPVVGVAVEADGSRRALAGDTTSTSWIVSLDEGSSLRLSLLRDVACPEGFVEALSSVLRGAFAQARALSRVAALSRRAHGEESRLRAALDAERGEVVAASPAMRALVREVVPLVAAQDVTVLVLGETGTGKEVIARRLHALSRRSRRPFVAVNCAALPEALAESALFGHERGAFTGALQRHAGVFERAHTGTLLLDEVGELSLAMQARLLRVLQEREVERVGGSEPLRVDVRVIAATHRDLRARVREGAFREDLYFRLAVVPLVIPPLRERPEDIDALALASARRLATRMGRPTPSFSHDDLSRLRRYAWPGNARELENVIERAMVLSPGARVTLPPDFDVVASVTPREPAAVGFDEAQRRAIAEALEACGGRVYGPDGAAARLGLKPTTLQSKIARLGLRRR
ncbi:MAG: sigma 54-interacting transcriptional regulator [Polyangiales bacterium]